MQLKAAQQALTSLWQQQRLPQVVLFYGRAGIPTDALLPWLLRLMFCRNAGDCRGCVDCHALSNGNHDDVLQYDTEQESFGVAEVSRVHDFLSLLGSTRVAIVRGAQRITRQAANKLLKVLEEPPPSAFILLTSTYYRQLLPTITSRCFHFLLTAADESSSCDFHKEFEQLLLASSWSVRLPLLKKLKEHKCNPQQFLFFYEHHLNRSYRAVLSGEVEMPHNELVAAVRRARLHALKHLLQQQVVLNTQLSIESVLATTQLGTRL